MQETLTKTLKEFDEELVDRIVQGLPAERRLRGLPPEERLRGLSPEEVATALSAEDAAQLRELLGRRQGR